MNIYLIFLILVIIIGVISYLEKRKYQQKLFKKYKLPKKFGLLESDLFVYNKKYSFSTKKLNFFQNSFNAFYTVRDIFGGYSAKAET